MSKRSLVPRSLGWIVASLCFAACVCGAAPAALASSIDYGDFGPDYPPGITIYQDVQESSGTDAVPLYGAPSLSGDSLDFDPMSFVASSTGGDGDITDGQLNFDILMLEVEDSVAGGMRSILFSESGDFTLFGGGTALSSVAAGISVDVRILEVDGNAISPISVFASSSIVRDLVSDGPVVLAPWSNALLIDFEPVLVANDIVFEFGVTRAELVIDDQLIALSEPDSAAFIAKKDLLVQPDIVPEPATAALLLAGLGALALRRRTC